MSPSRAAGAAGPPPPLPPPLARELAHRPDGPALAGVWDQLAAASPGSEAVDATRRADAWARVAAAAGIPVDVRRRRPASDAPAPAAAGARPTPRPAPRPAWASRVRGAGRARWVAVASLALAAAGVGARVAGTVRVAAAPGARTVVTLPDGSRAELNAGSSLQYARGFLGWPVGDAGVRRVRLEGEAFFSVTRGGGRFVVETSEARVTVLGTRFGVRARGGTDVMVEEGRVQVAAAPRRGAAASAPVVLTAGEGTSVAAGGAPAPGRRAPVAQLVAWRRGGFAAVDQPLATVLDELGRRYAVDVALRAPAAAGDRVTLYYPRPVGAETIVADVCAARGLHYRRTSRGYEVF